MKEKEIPTTMCVGVYYYMDDETGKPVFDVEEMMNEFSRKLEMLSRGISV